MCDPNVSTTPQAMMWPLARPAAEPIAPKSKRHFCLAENFGYLGKFAAPGFSSGGGGGADSGKAPRGTQRRFF